MSAEPAPRRLAEWDRAAAHAASRLEAFERELGDADRAGAADPAAVARALRAFATRDNLTLLADQPCSLSEEEQRDATRRWMEALLVNRVGLAEAAAYGRALADRTTLDSSTGKRVPAPSALDLWSALRRSQSDEEGRLALDALATRARGARAPRRERLERRREAARLLGLAHPLDAGAPLPFAASVAAAEALLRATHDLAKETVRHAVADGVARGARPSCVATIRLAIARSAHHGWPARVTSRWLSEQIAPMLEGRRVEPDSVPETLGSASFLRGAYRMGSAIRRALRPRHIPFVVAHAPGDGDGHALGATLALTFASPEFQRRALGLGADAAKDEARALARTALLDVRRAAASLLLHDDDGERFEELSEAAFGAALPDAMAGTWPRPRGDVHVSWLARAAAPRRVAQLRDRHDEDFFLNPRAAQTLIPWAACPAALLVEASEESLTADVRAWARLLEETLA